MYYELNELQAKLIAEDFQHLVGKTFKPTSNVPIETVFAQNYHSDNWRVILSTYTGDKDNPWGLMEHTNLWTTLFEYLKENKKEDEFNPHKYGLPHE
jgi:hypothetical protein